VQSIFLGGVIVEIATPIHHGIELGIDLTHPALGAVTSAVGVAWCRPLAGHANPVAALEFRGSWDGLVVLRSQLAAYLGNRVFDGPRLVGYVLQEPNDVASSCFDVQTAKIALLGPHSGRFAVRRRDAPQGSALEIAPTYIEALQLAFGLSTYPSLNVPGAAAPPPPPPPPPGPPPSESDEDEEIFGMNTVVLKPEVVVNEEEQAILGARTVVVTDSEAKISGVDSAVLGGGGFGPKAKGSVHSKVFADDELIGYIAPSVAENSWNVYGKNGKKLALLASSDDGSIRVCVMGRKADESLVFLEADDRPTALAMAFKWEGAGALAVDPPLAGF
jgi:hypothetical protein